MKISEELRKFIWVKFEKMKLDSLQLQVEREKQRRKKDRDRMRRARRREAVTPTSVINAREIVTKGKADHDFNNFLCYAYYLIKKETSARDSHIYNWLENFLKEQEYKNGHYDFDAIRQLVRVHYKTLDPNIKKYFKKVFDFTYKDFSQSILPKK